ncbi:hypothetical protein TIFTF001_009193 [Ficus carica]|uniref:Uncharacterized protein n=1 Tax=Ficus carica TaxID=3494 RepID=A0AA88D147_FICCA|nr:hypothetical protein TIFTF001_009193 [Ficus carica]
MEYEQDYGRSSFAFSLLFTFYSTIVDHKKGDIDGLGPTLTGSLVEPTFSSAVPSPGASKNPARHFGPALVSWDWRADNWFYWVGPFISGGLCWAHR